LEFSRLVVFVRKSTFVASQLFLTKVLLHLKMSLLFVAEKRQTGRIAIMLLDLTDILHESGAVITREFCLETDDVDDVVLAEKVRGELRIQNARRNIILSGKASAAVQLPCARCLKQFDYPLELTFEAAAPISLFQIPGLPVVPEEELDDEEDLLDDEIRSLFEGHSLNVSELVRQAIWLQTPINPLCAEDCNGLEEFANSDDNVDPRLDQLKNWANRNGG
jgi:uncharacterized protein